VLALGGGWDKSQIPKLEDMAAKEPKKTN
jgi:hypothetical protein